uniref:Uncharacterized protein n=1 Tax=Piliocolobus tephrosceles TaxID=591936 RepID=A0A8C9GN68_9PRIM
METTQVYGSQPATIGPPFLKLRPRLLSAVLRFTLELLRIDTFQICKYGHQCHLP